MVVLYVTEDMTLFAMFANGIYITATDCYLSFLNVTAIKSLSPALTSFTSQHLLCRRARWRIQNGIQREQHCDKMTVMVMCLVCGVSCRITLWAVNVMQRNKTLQLLFGSFFFQLNHGYGVAHNINTALPQHFRIMIINETNNFNQHPAPQISECFLSNLARYNYK